MAIDYTEVFDCIRQYVKAINNAVAWQTLCDTIEAGVEGTLATAGRYDEISGQPEAFAGYKDTLGGLISSWITDVNSLLANETLLAGELPVGSSTDATTILKALIKQMILETESVAESVVTIGAVTANALNVGDSTLLLDGTLDGASSPASGFPAVREYAGVLTELAAAGAFTVVCVADSQTDRRTEGDEQ
jgi:hypothetical protein